MPKPQLLANALRFLAIDAVQKANSGHPGMPMGMADIATVLWRDFLQHNPNNPRWINRDRFVLSNGHGSMLLYALLHLTGYDLSLEDLKNFRQLHSKTPGHPEFHLTPGVETTTGPLGQGLGNAVGMALAERHLAAQFNQPEFTLIDHFTYAFCGDGCLMEGVSHEACSFAGAQKIGKLIVFWDDNGISIDGDIKQFCIDDVPTRFRSYQWQVLSIDGHDPNAIADAIKAAQANTTQPTLICCKTQIGFGSPNKANTAHAHGSPLGEAEVALTRETLAWPYAPFEIPAEIYDTWNHQSAGKATETAWQAVFSAYQKKYPKKAALFNRVIEAKLPEDWSTETDRLIEEAAKNQTAMATRKSSQLALDQLVLLVPELLGGSADLTESNNTRGKTSTLCDANNPSGQYIEYGVREFGMSTIMNGIALHGGLIPYGGTFLTFSDYARNAIRLCAMMEQRVIFVYSHDSIGLGEDGPTHQAVEQLPALRLIPGLEVWRPADHTETIVAWQQAIEAKHPTALLLTRQNVTQQPRNSSQLAAIQKGGYILWQNQPTIEAIILATGSEVELAILAAIALEKENIYVRVVSMPCCERFKKQPEQYRHEVLPMSIKNRIAVEAAQPDYWWQFVGSEGAVLGVQQFGFSAPYKAVYEALGLTVLNLMNLVKKKACKQYA